MDQALPPDIINQLFSNSTVNAQTLPTNETKISQYFAPPQVDQNRFDLEDIQQAYENLLPQNREKDLDIFGLKKRSGPNQTRTKGDKASSILSIIAEGLGAALGGNKYKNPYARAHEQFNEDFKLQAPRLMEQERILSQNIRASEALEAAEKKNAAREALDRDKMALQMRLAQIRSNTALSVAQKKAETQKELAEFAVRYPKDQELARWAAIQGKDIFELRDDPEAMSKAMAGINANKILPFAARSLFAPTKSIQSVPYSREHTNEFGEIQTLHGTKPMVVSGPNSAAQNFIRQSLAPGSQIDYSLLPGSQSPQQPTAPANAAPDVVRNLFQPQPGQNSSAPASNQRPQYEPRASVTPAMKPLAISTEEEGAAPIKDEPPLELATSPVYQMISDKQNPYLAYKSSDFGLHFAQNGEMVYTGQDNKPVIVAAPRFGKNNRQDKIDFDNARKAMHEMNTLARLVAIQFVRRKGNLYTGKYGPVSADDVQNAQMQQRGFWGALARLSGKATVGREADDIDKTISRMANSDVLSKILFFTGKANRESEKTMIQKISADIHQNPAAFLETVLSLSVEANRKFLEEYKRALRSQGGKVSLSNVTVDAGEVKKQVQQIRTHIDRVMQGKEDFNTDFFNAMTQQDAVEIRDLIRARKK